MAAAAKKNARKELVEDKILEQAAELFSEKGVAGTALQDIADVMGLSRPSLYYYFENKEALLTALVKEITFKAADELEALRKRRYDSVREKLRSAVYHRTLKLIARRKRFRMLDRSEAALPQKVADVHRDAKRKVLKEFARIIEQGIRRGEFRPVNSTVAALGLIGMSNWAAWWFSEDGVVSAEEVAREYSEMAVRALVAGSEDAKHGHSVADALRIIKDQLACIEALSKQNARNRF